MAISEAVESAGRLPDARRYLEAQLGAFDDESDRARLHRRRGMLALRAGDVAGADRELRAALRLADALGAYAEAAQLHLRMALTALMQANFPGAGEHVAAAVAAWSEGGAFEPLWTAAEELRSLAAEPALTTVAGGVLEKLRAAIETAASRDSLRPEEPAALVSEALDQMPVHH